MDILSYVLSKKYIEDSLNGAGALVGKSAYEIAVEYGFEGSPEEWLEFLKGSNGDDGKSAYEIAVEYGFEGSEQEWLESLKSVSMSGLGLNSTIFNDITNTANGDYSHAEGYQTSVSEGTGAHAEGYTTRATGDGSHAEGHFTIAEEKGSHAEGYGEELKKVRAIGQGSHAEGISTQAIGRGSHTEGINTYASTRGAHAEGWYTCTGCDYQHVQGKFNMSSNLSEYAHVVGNGTEDKLSNAHTLDWEGNAWYQGDVYVGGLDQFHGSDKLATTSYVISSISSINMPNGFIARSKPPENKNLLWLDTDDDTNETEELATREYVNDAIGEAHRERLFELIERVETTEEISSFIRDKEPNGKAYNFMRLYMNVFAPKVENSIAGYIEVNNKKTVYTAYMAHTSDRETAVAAEVRNGALCVSGHNFSTSEGDTASYSGLYKDGFITLGETEINKVSAYLVSDSFPIGTVFEIWGVRS